MAKLIELIPKFHRIRPVHLDSKPEFLCIRFSSTRERNRKLDAGNQFKWKLSKRAQC